MINRARTQRSNRATIAQRVYGLLRFPFTPWIREHTIRQLLNDPATREETIVQLNLRRMPEAR